MHEARRATAAAAANLIIADANPNIRCELTDLLTGLGHTVVAQAESGGQVLALARTVRPDAAFIDLALADGPGAAPVRALIDERIVPVILLIEGNPVSGGAAAPGLLWQRFSLSGVFGILSKPVRPADVGPAIDIALARFQEIHTLEQEVKDLGERMEARKLVGRAKAILMETQGLSEREAFRRIQAQSASLNKPAHEIAQAIITASGIPIDPLLEGGSSNPRKPMT